MTQISELQQKFPLSPKKFWKKLTERIPRFVFSSLFLGFFVGFIFAFIIPAMLHTVPQSAKGIPLAQFLHPFIIGVLTIFILNILIDAI
jgi:hypothetical protein